MKRLVYVFLLIASLVITTGCGKKDIMDMYSFGTQDYSLGQSTISVEVPFGLPLINNYPDGTKISNVNRNEVTYLGSDKNMSIVIAGQKRELNSPEKELPIIASDILNKTKNAGTIKIINSTITKKDIDGKTAENLVIDYIERDKKQSINQYILYNDGVVWNIIYIYNTGDEVGQDLVKYLDGKIEIVQ